MNDLIDKLAAETVEELLEVSRNPNGESWFFVIRRKLEALANDLRERRKK